MIQRRLYKDYDAAKAAAKVKTLGERLLADGQAGSSAKMLDELYSIALFAIKEENTVILLQVAELFKLAYGQKYNRPDEEEYWREVLLAALGKKNFQAAEYFLEGGKLLFKNMPEKRAALAGIFKMAGVLSMDEGKLFIGARIINIFLAWLPKLSQEEGPVITAVVECIENIGTATIKAGDEEFFREICTLLAKNVGELEERQVCCWDNLFISWLRFALKTGSIENTANLMNFLSVYSALRRGVSGGKDVFYAGLIDVTGRFLGKAGDIYLKDLLNKLVTLAGPFVGRPALEAAFKAAVSSIGWRRALAIFENWFVLSLRFLAREYVMDGREGCRQDFLAASGRAFAEAAGFAAIIDKVSALSILLSWREWLLGKTRSQRAKNRANRLFAMIVAAWQNRHPLQAEKEKDLLAQF